MSYRYNSINNGSIITVSPPPVKDNTTYLASRYTSIENPYNIVEVAIVTTSGFPDKPGKLCVGAAPGKKDHKWNRDLDLDLKTIKKSGVNVVICLLEWGEMSMLNILDYPMKSQRYGLLFNHFPIRDMSIPEIDELNALIPLIVEQLARGLNILIHCRAGLGRAGTIIACCLIHFGYDAQGAIEAIRTKRPGSIQTKEQENIVAQYYHKLHKLLRM